jgi:hypothetical protein
VDKNRALELRALRKEALTQLLPMATLSAATAKDILRVLIESEIDFDLRVQELEREVGLSDSFISPTDVSSNVLKIV